VGGRGYGESKQAKKASPLSYEELQKDIKEQEQRLREQDKRLVKFLTELSSEYWNDPHLKAAFVEAIRSVDERV